MSNPVENDDTNTSSGNIEPDWEIINKQLRNVPMASVEKPDINGFREGDRVILTKAFQGDTLQYEMFSTGTILITNTGSAHIKVGREADLHEVLMDDRRIIMIAGSSLRIIPGVRMEVTYSEDGKSVSVQSANTDI